MKEDILSTEEYLSQLDESNVILFFKEHIENLCHTVFKLIHQLRSYCKYNQKTVSESDCIAQCMLQMGLLRTKSILNLLKGQSLLENSNLLIQDIPSILSVLRSYYELCFTFHNIFITQQSDAEREIVLSIWEIRGFQNRQGLNNVPEEYKEKEAKEKNEIENLKNKVSVLLLQLKVPDNVIKDCKKILDYKGTSLKGYYFVKSNGEITGIKGIHVDNGINQIICDDDAKNLYRITSSHIHSSFLSVLQFGQMFNDNINSYVKTIIKSTYILLATILYDFCCYSNDAHIILNQIDKDAFEILSYILKENKHDYINCIRK